MRLLAGLLAAVVCIVTLPAERRAGGAVDRPAEVEEAAVEAYLYAYPLVLMEVWRRQATNVEETGKQFMRGPMGQWIHARTCPDVSYRSVVRANVDTLYSHLWGDVSREPVVVVVPDTQGRYFLMQCADMWSEVFAAPGARTTGTAAQTYAVVGPDWRGDLPGRMKAYRSPTPVFKISTRIQCNGKDDYAFVNRLQDGFKAVPLSAWGKGASTPPRGKVDPAVDMKTPPVQQVAAMNAGAYFDLFAELLGRYPPHECDYPILDRMERVLGLVRGKGFDVADQKPAVRQALERAMKEGPRRMAAKVEKLAPVVNGWQMPTEGMGTYGTHYLTRATVALVALGANVPEDTVYAIAFTDGDGQPLDGGNRYVLRFEREQLPPANAFWSVTLYGKDGFFVDNALHRYALGDRDRLQFEPDGSLTLYIQAQSPGKDRESNWLPAPKEAFNLTARLYWPRPATLDGTWRMPPVKKGNR
jgi:hypothetical protein